MTRIRTSADLRELLDSLGSDCDEVADSLRAEGIKGKPVSAEFCPISNFIKAQTGQRALSSQSGSDILYRSMWINAPLSKGVSTFITLFDDGCYPDLIAS